MLQSRVYGSHCRSPGGTRSTNGTDAAGLRSLYATASYGSCDPLRLYVTQAGALWNESTASVGRPFCRLGSLSGALH